MDALDWLLVRGVDPRVRAVQALAAGQPAMLRDGYAPVPEPDNAQHRLQLDWRIGAAPEPSTENDLLALRFYRLLFALDARSDAIRWVRTFDHDLVGAAIQPGGLFVADSAGSCASSKVREQSGSGDLGRAKVLAIRPRRVPATAAAQRQRPRRRGAAAQPRRRSRSSPRPRRSFRARPSCRRCASSLYAAARAEDDGSEPALVRVETLAMIEASRSPPTSAMCAERTGRRPGRMPPATISASRTAAQVVEGCAAGRRSRGTESPPSRARAGGRPRQLKQRGRFGVARRIRTRRRGLGPVSDARGLGPSRG